MHVDINPRAMMGDLQASYKQIVEIAKIDPDGRQAYHHG